MVENSQKDSDNFNGEEDLLLPGGSGRKYLQDGNALN